MRVWCLGSLKGWGQGLLGKGRGLWMAGLRPQGQVWPRGPILMCEHKCNIWGLGLKLAGTLLESI